jgi:hypothetical protein
MTRRVRNWIALFVFVGISIGFLTGASLIVFLQTKGILTTAHIASCRRLQRSSVCHGTWRIDGQSYGGTVENTTSDDLYSDVQVRALGNKAIRPGLRMPIVFYVAGVAFAVMGFFWWKNELSGTHPKTGASSSIAG